MGLIHCPNIAIDGLVLCLDATNQRSYGVSTTKWADLSKSKSNGDLVNNPTHSVDKFGQFAFDGVNDVCGINVPNLGSVATVEMWCRIKPGYTNKMFFGWYMYDVWCADGALGYNTAGSDQYGFNSTRVSELGLVNNWFQYIFEMYTDSYTNNKIYINTEPQTLSQLRGSQRTNNLSFNNGVGRIACWTYDFSYIMPMDCAIFRVYNRALDRSEIVQNFNSLKLRFGI